MIAIKDVGWSEDKALSETMMEVRDLQKRVSQMRLTNYDICSFRYVRNQAGIIYVPEQSVDSRESIKNGPLTLLPSR